MELIEIVRRAAVIEVPDELDLFGERGRARLLDAARDVAVEVEIELTDAVVAESGPHDRVDYRL